MKYLSRRLPRMLAAVLAFALVAASCGDDEDDAPAADQPTVASADEPADESILG